MINSLTESVNTYCVTMRLVLISRRYLSWQVVILWRNSKCHARFSKEDQALVICMPRKSTHTTTE
jgi:hypothetical protein